MVRFSARWDLCLGRKPESAPLHLLSDALDIPQALLEVVTRIRPGLRSSSIRPYTLAT